LKGCAWDYDTSSPPCMVSTNQEGITCSDGQVVRIDLGGSSSKISPYGLKGSIPQSIGNLTGLGFLNFSSNEITGSLPTSIGQLTELKFLYLGRNSISGPIPPDIGNLTKLIDLDLGYNKLEGELPKEMSALQDLLFLFLDENKLSGEIPSWLKKEDGFSYDWLLLAGNDWDCPPTNYSEWADGKQDYSTQKELCNLTSKDSSSTKKQSNGGGGAFILLLMPLVFLLGLRKYRKSYERRKDTKAA